MSIYESCRHEKKKSNQNTKHKPCKQHNKLPMIYDFVTKSAFDDGVAAHLKCYQDKIVPPSDVPKTRVGHDSMRAVKPFRKIWCRKRTVSELRNIELMSSWVQGGFLLLAAILKGLRKQEIRISSWSTYSSSDSTIRNTKLKVKI